MRIILIISIIFNRIIIDIWILKTRIEFQEVRRIKERERIV